MSEQEKTEAEQAEEAGVGPNPATEGEDQPTEEPTPGSVPPPGEEQGSPPEQGEEVPSGDEG